MDEAELDRQAQIKAEQALAGLPEGARAVKLAKVKEGILKRLRVEAAACGGVAPPPGVPSGMAPPAPPSGPPPPGPAPPPPPAQEDVAPVPKLEGIEMIGDETWFADFGFRTALRKAVVDAHAEQKILVGNPAQEIKRIWPGGGRVLGAGAVLRLGGSTLGGYGEPDIAYAYRQLSRALHPDKNRGVPEAPDAFKRLSEAADELRATLTESRAMLQTIAGMLGDPVTPEMLERPQESLFAEATKMLHAVLALSGEGEVPVLAVQRSLQAFQNSSVYGRCAAQNLLAEWYEQPHLLALFSSPHIRTAYDCSKKRLRAQFLCALNRATLAEAKRHNECVRGNWQEIMMQFPEIGLWRELHEKIRTKVWTKDSEEKRERGSMWDSSEAPKNEMSAWAKQWRRRISAVVPRGIDSAAPWTDPEVRQLSAALWKEVAAWARTPEVNAERHLQLLTSEPPAPGSAQAPDEWGFVPAADVLLIVGEGIFGITAEGLMADSKPGQDRMTWADVLAGKIEEKMKEEEEKKKAKERERQEREEERSRKDKDKDRERDSSRDRDRRRGGGSGDKPKNDPNFDWEQVWRQRVQTNRSRRGGRASSPAPGGRNRSPSRGRGRRRNSSRSPSRRRGRSRSRDRRRSRSRSR